MSRSTYDGRLIYEPSYDYRQEKHDKTLKILLSTPSCLNIISKLTEIVSLFLLSNYGINYQKKWCQPAVSVLLYLV